ncbi:MAG: peptidylprolyl isomerase [Chloroflexota bacterium]
MTSTTKKPTAGTTPPKGKTPPKQHRLDPEERFTQRVTILFVGLIVAVIAIVVLAFVYSWYQGHLQPVASVGGENITRDQWGDRAKLEFERLQNQAQSVREQLSAGTLTADEGNAKLQQIQTDQGNVASSSIENLIDLAFKGQLAQKAGVTIGDADVDQAMKEEAISPEARKLSVIFIDPAANSTSGTATPAEEQAAWQSAQDAVKALADGKAFADVAKQYSTDASKDKGGDYGFVSKDSTIDPAFIGTVFALQQGETSPVVKGADGVWRIGRVDEIRAGQMDGGYEQAMRDTVGWDLWRGQVRKETVAKALEAKIVADATGGDQDQAHVAEIVVLGDTTADPASDQGSIRARHILYSPKDDPQGASTLDAADPAWAAAEAEAQQAVDQLAKVTDPAKREIAFATRAKLQSDDTGSGANGGDLGYFTRDQMVAAFADPLFTNPDLVKGDVIGPVKSQFGYHVIMFEDRTKSLADRKQAVDDALKADGADFAAIAKQLSEGAEAPGGGDLGWLAKAQLEDAAWTAITALQPNGVTEAIPETDGYHWYELIEQAKKPLDTQQAAIIGDTAFADWYDPQKETAGTDGTITRDSNIFSNAPSVGG